MQRTPLAHEFLARAYAGEGRTIGLTDSSVMARLVNGRYLHGGSYELTTTGRALFLSWERERIVLQHARRISATRPMVCTPSDAERRGDEPRKASSYVDGRVIYPNQEAAAAAAAALEAIGQAPQEPVSCPRSTRGHFHLVPTTTSQEATQP